MCFVAFLFFYLLNCHANVLLLRLATFLQVKIFAGCMSFVLLRFVVSPFWACLNTISGSKLFFVCFVAALILFCLCYNSYLPLLCLATYLQVTIYAGCMSFLLLRFVVSPVRTCLNAISGSQLFFVCFVASLIFFCLCCNAYLLLLCLTTFLQVAIYAGCMSFWRLLFHVCFLFDCVHAICGPCFMFCAFVARFSYFFCKIVWT